MRSRVLFIMHGQVFQHILGKKKLIYIPCYGGFSFSNVLVKSILMSSYLLGVAASIICLSFDTNQNAYCFMFIFVLIMTFRWLCSGVIGFLICSTEGAPVDFRNPANPIEMLDGALNYRRELRFYNSEVMTSFPFFCLVYLVYYFARL